eukprot:jgi/Hompol1/3102/HPOL_003124-RA
MKRNALVRVIAKQEQQISLTDTEKQDFKELQDREAEWCVLELYFPDLNFTVMFTTVSNAFGVLGQPTFVAYITRANASVRLELDKEDIEWEDVERSGSKSLVRRYERQLDRDGDRILDMSDPEDLNDDEQVNGGCQTDELGRVADKGSRRSTKSGTIKVSSSRSVHNLFDYLLNWVEPRSEMRAQGSPQLYAPKAFLNASLKRTQIIRNGRVQQAVDDP